jgi:hypothetical protein
MSDSSYAIPTDMNGNPGDELLKALTTEQSQLITSLVDIQDQNTFHNFHFLSNPEQLT